MKPHLCKLILFTLFCIMPLLSLATDSTPPKSLALAKQLLMAQCGENAVAELENFNNVTDGFQDKVNDAQQKALATATPEESVILKKIFALSSPPKTDIILQMQNIYAKTYTTEELKAATSFFASTTGKHFIEAQSFTTNNIPPNTENIKLATQLYESMDPNHSFGEVLHKKDLISLFSTQLAASELEQSLEFFNSPIGRSYALKQKEISDSMQAIYDEPAGKAEKLQALHSELRTLRADKKMSNSQKPIDSE